MRLADIGVVILAGGGSRRMGSDKAVLMWNGVTAVERLAATARDLNLGPLIVSGADHGLPFAPDPFPQAGPVAGLCTAARILMTQGCQRLLVLAVDAPTLEPQDLTPLLEAPAPGATYAGLPLPMVIEAAALPVLPGNAPLRLFVEAAGLAALPTPPHAYARLRGANTQPERQDLLRKSRSS